MKKNLIKRGILTNLIFILIMVIVILFGNKISKFLTLKSNIKFRKKYEEG